MVKDILVTIDGINKRYGKQQALSNVSFEIPRGEICGLVGQNGAGKTTLLRVLSGLIKANSGQVHQGGAYKIGALIESPALYPNMSAYDNLTYLALKIGLKHPHERVLEVLKVVGLADVDKRKKVKNFSLGMRQRMAIALAILDFPDLLILDEPINGLDPAGIKEMREIIHHLRDNYGITVLISSHILSELELVVDRFVIMHKGAVIKDVSQSDLRQEVARRIRLSTSDNEKVYQHLIAKEMAVEVVKDYLSLPTTYTVQEVIDNVMEIDVQILGVYQSGTSFEDYYFGLLA